MDSLPFTDLVEDCTGGNPKVKTSDYLLSGKIPVVDQSANFISGYVDDESLACKVSLPCIVFGDHTRGIKFIDFPFALGADGVKILKPCERIDPKFLYHYLRSVQLPEDQGYSRHFKFLKRVAIPLFSLSEQRRIATILDKTDTIRRKRRQVIDLMNDFLRSVFLEMFGDPIANPKQLDVCKLGDIVQLVSGGTPSKSNPAFWEGNIPWVSPKDMKRFWLSDSEDHVSSTVPEETNLKMITDKTVLIVVRGMILAHTVPICMTRVPVTINQDIKALLPTTKINPVYLAWALLVQHDSILGRVSTASHGTKRLETDVLLATPVTVPPLKSQQQFEVIVEKYRELHEKVADQSRLDGVLFNSLSHSLLEAGGT
jgi:type I restriction enzyme S subunit